MNLCMFFEGTGQGVAGKITNVTRLRDLCVDDARQKLHLEPGLGTHFGSYLAGRIAGVDWRTTFRSARRWFEANYETLPKDTVSTKVFLFGFSRGALLARHFAAWLDKLGISVAYIGLWDTGKLAGTVPLWLERGHGFVFFVKPCPTADASKIPSPR